MRLAREMADRVFRPERRPALQKSSLHSWLRAAGVALSSKCAKKPLTTRPTHANANAVDSARAMSTAVAAIISLACQQMKRGQNVPIASDVATEQKSTHDKDAPHTVDAALQ